MVTQEAQKFTINVSTGSLGGAGAGASRDLWPDVHVILADGAKMVGDRGWRDKQYVNPQLVIVECENEGARSTLVTGKPSMRLFAYLMLKQKHRKDDLPPLFVLVTWEKNRGAYKDVGLFDEVWWVPDG